MGSWREWNRDQAPVHAAQITAAAIDRQTAALNGPRVEFHNETAFLEAWKCGIELAGIQFFACYPHSAADYTSKWDLAPDYDLVERAMGYLSSGEAVFLGAMYSFFNATAGAKMLAKRGISSPGDIAAVLDERRRRVIADLIVSYTGW